jgi:hypothetical protein
MSADAADLRAGLSALPAANLSLASSSAIAAAAQVLADPPSAAIRLFRAARSPISIAAAVSPPGSCHGEAASARLSSSRLRSSRSRGYAVATAPRSKYCPVAPPSSSRSLSEILATSNHPASARITAVPPRGSQPARTRRFHSTDSAIAR